MKLYIKETKITLDAFIYGLDGTDKTEEFFERYLSSAMEKIVVCGVVYYNVDTVEEYCNLSKALRAAQTAINAAYNTLARSENPEKDIWKYVAKGRCYLI